MPRKSKRRRKKFYNRKTQLEKSFTIGINAKKTSHHFHNAEKLPKLPLKLRKRFSYLKGIKKHLVAGMKL